MKRPNNIWRILGSGLVSLPLGFLLSSAFPKYSVIRNIVLVGGIAIPPIAVLVYSEKKWLDYHSSMQVKYEKSKEYLRSNKDCSLAREAMLKAGREYYSCMRENSLPTIYDEQAINNDLKAILG